MLRLRNKLLAGPFAAVLAIASTSAVQASDKSIIETASAAGNFTMFLKAIEKAGLTEKLNGEGAFTVFAPTDEAFEALPEGQLATLFQPEGKERLVAILNYHIVPQKLASRDIGGRMLSPVTLQGDTLTIHSAGRMTKVGKAALLIPDVEASNGVVHAIDRVLLPDSG